MNAGLLNRLALETGGAHYPEVFKQYQEDYTKKVLMECYKVFLDSNQSDRKSTRLNSSHIPLSRMPSSA